MAESPFSWKRAEQIIFDELQKHQERQQGPPVPTCGPSLPKQIADRLRAEGLLVDDSSSIGAHPGTIPWRVHDTVKLRHDIPSSGLKQGQLGAILIVHEPFKYEVEFFPSEKEPTISHPVVMTVSKNEVELVQEIKSS